MEKTPVVIISITAFIVLLYLFSLIKQNTSKSNNKMSKADQSTQTDNTTLKTQIKDISSNSNSTMSSKENVNTSETYLIPSPPPPPMPTKNKKPSYHSKRTLKSDTGEVDDYTITPEILRSAKSRLKKPQDREDKKINNSVR